MKGAVAVPPPHSVSDGFLLLLNESGSYRVWDKEISKETELPFYWCHFAFPQGTRHRILEKPDREFNALVLPACGNVSCPERAKLLLQQLNEIAMRQFPCRESLCNMALMLLLAELAVTPTDGNTADKVADWICHHIAEIGSAKDVAKYFGYNCEYLTTALRRATGKTLTDHIRDARIEQAKKLLRYSELSIKEIAHRCGFSDEKYFSKVFRVVTATTPGKYRAH
ncbi:MAG: helix-turn-helix transcriptional regulator [Clostridia bacterium]|nr:helix-turn-helix transcriptional regulator [Clostridia bacterium]